MFMRPPETDPSDAPLSPEQERVLRKFRRFSSVSMLVMLVGLVVVFGVIGYRMLRSTPPAGGEVTALLPKGARIVATAVSGRVLVVTLDIAGATEIRTYDVETLAPGGRLRFAQEP